MAVAPVALTFVGDLHMATHSQPMGPASSLVGLNKNDAGQKPADELRSTLITGYEQALEHGLAPSSALAEVLSWAADECGRLREAELKNR